MSTNRLLLQFNQEQSNLNKAGFTIICLLALLRSVAADDHKIKTGVTANDCMLIIASAVTFLLVPVVLSCLFRPSTNKRPALQMLNSSDVRSNMNNPKAMDITINNKDKGNDNFTDVSDHGAETKSGQKPR